MTLAQTGMNMVAKRLPKVIDPKTHAFIDYAVAATFFAMGAMFWNRNRKRAAMSSFICGAATTVNSVLTDYPGGVWKRISFQTHGRIDAGLGGMTGMMPSFMGFRDDRESQFFTVSALAETAATAMTDFDAMGRTDHYRMEEAA